MITLDVFQKLQASFFSCYRFDDVPQKRPLSNRKKLRVRLTPRKGLIIVMWNSLILHFFYGLEHDRGHLVERQACEWLVVHTRIIISGLQKSMKTKYRKLQLFAVVL